MHNSGNPAWFCAGISATCCAVIAVIGLIIASGSGGDSSNNGAPPNNTTAFTGDSPTVSNADHGSLEFLPNVVVTAAAAAAAASLVVAAGVYAYKWFTAAPTSSAPASEPLPNTPLLPWQNTSSLPEQYTNNP